MARQIETETLRAWLDTGQPVTVLDIRSDDDRAQWAIPGSVHVNAYDALRTGLPGALADAVFPANRPVVTVCNAGRVSQTAADVLSARGFDARSLTGGMKAWSLAWNAADVPLSDAAVAVIQVRRTGKGCLSYIVGSGAEAAVIDPSVAPDVYLALARGRGWSIRYVLDTHVHADHLSRARELARHTGASLLLPPQQRVTFAFTAIADGERVSIGAASLTAMLTPVSSRWAMRPTWRRAPTVAPYGDPRGDTCHRGKRSSFVVLHRVPVRPQVQKYRELWCHAARVARRQVWSQHAQQERAADAGHDAFRHPAMAHVAQLQLANREHRPGVLVRVQIRLTRALVAA